MHFSHFRCKITGFTKLSALSTATRNEWGWGSDFELRFAWAQNSVPLSLIAKWHLSLYWMKGEEIVAAEEECKVHRLVNFDFEEVWETILLQLAITYSPMDQLCLAMKVRVFYLGTPRSLSPSALTISSAGLWRKHVASIFIRVVIPIPSSVKLWDQILLFAQVLHLQ